MKQKLAGIVLAMCMTAGAAAGSADMIQIQQVQAAGIQQESTGYTRENGSYEQDGYQYKVLNNGTIEITRYTGTEQKLVIPDEINGKKVTRIGDSSFSQCENLQSVTIPEGVVSLADYAFCYNAKLSSVVFPKSLASIGEHAFLGCKSLKKIKLPDKLTNIGWNTFADCTGLTDIQLPQNLKTIDMEAFRGCTGLKRVSLPKKVWQIGELAFGGCKNLKRIDLPKSIKEIGKSAFAECGKLTDVYYAGSKAERKKVRIIGRGNQNLMGAAIHYGNASKAEVFAPKKGSVLKSGQDSYRVRTAVSSVSYLKTARKDAKLTIPAQVVIDGIVYDVEAVAANAFRNNKKVSKITIQGNIRAIGANAFRNCSKLKTVVIKSSILKSVGADAVKGTPANLKIQVPFNQASRYKNLFKGKGLGKKAVIVEY